MEALAGKKAGRDVRELEAKVCVRNLHTAHFSLFVGRALIADRQLPGWSLSCTVGMRQRCGGVAVTHQLRGTPQMPDVQVSPSPETRDYLNISETADRSRLAVKTIYNWISLGRLGPREGVCRVGRKVVIHWPTFEAAVMRRGTNGVA
jgi:hypothetical protein